MVRRTLIVLTVLLVSAVLPAIAAPVDQPTVERDNEITIRGTYDAPARVDFEYPEPATVEAVRVSTADSPPAPRVELFSAPDRMKGAGTDPGAEFTRPDQTVVEEYSMLELLGIGAGVAAVLLLL